MYCYCRNRSGRICLGKNTIFNRSVVKKKHLNGLCFRNLESKGNWTRQKPTHTHITSSGILSPFISSAYTPIHSLKRKLEVNNNIVGNETALSCFLPSLFLITPQQYTVAISRTCSFFSLSPNFIDIFSTFLIFIKCFLFIPTVLFMLITFPLRYFSIYLAVVLRFLCYLWVIIALQL